jgi:lipoate-protein ligase B
MICVYYSFGLIEYNEAYALQQRIWEEKVAGRQEDVLLLLEHYPTLTLGKSGKLSNLLVNEEKLSAESISVHFTDRGGDITYHGPGQLVVYPIINLQQQARDVEGYIRGLEQSVIATLADFSIAAGRDEEHVGVWVDREKICAIGVRISKRITMHGLALNVSPNLDHFSFITPCGIVGRGVTSMTKLLGSTPSIEKVKERFVTNFSTVFSCNMEEGAIEQLGYAP